MSGAFDHLIEKYEEDAPAESVNVKSGGAYDHLIARVPKKTTQEKSVPVHTDELFGRGKNNKKNEYLDKSYVTPDEEDIRLRQSPALIDLYEKHKQSTGVFVKSERKSEDEFYKDLKALVPEVSGIGDDVNPKYREFANKYNISVGDVKSLVTQGKSDIYINSRLRRGNVQYESDMLTEDERIPSQKSMMMRFAVQPPRNRKTPEGRLYNDISTGIANTIKNSPGDLAEFSKIVLNPVNIIKGTYSIAQMVEQLAEAGYVDYDYGVDEYGNNLGYRDLDAFVQYFADSYGGWDKLSAFAQTRPVMFASDFLTAASLAGVGISLTGKLAPFGIKGASIAAGFAKKGIETAMRSAGMVGKFDASIAKIASVSGTIEDFMTRAAPIIDEYGKSLASAAATVDPAVAEPVLAGKAIQYGLKKLASKNLHRSLARGLVAINGAPADLKNKLYDMFAERGKLTSQKYIEKLLDEASALKKNLVDHLNELGSQGASVTLQYVTDWLRQQMSTSKERLYSTHDKAILASIKHLEEQYAPSAPVTNRMINDTINGIVSRRDSYFVARSRANEAVFDSIYQTSKDSAGRTSLFDIENTISSLKDSARYSDDPVFAASVDRAENHIKDRFGDSRKISRGKFNVFKRRFLGTLSEEKLLSLEADKIVHGKLDDIAKWFTSVDIDEVISQLRDLASSPEYAGNKNISDSVNRVISDIKKHSADGARTLTEGSIRKLQSRTLGGGSTKAANESSVNSRIAYRLDSLYAKKKGNISVNEFFSVFDDMEKEVGMADSIPEFKSTLRDAKEKASRMFENDIMMSSGDINTLIKNPSHYTGTSAPPLYIMPKPEIDKYRAYSAISDELGSYIGMSSDITIGDVASYLESLKTNDLYIGNKEFSSAADMVSKRLIDSYGGNAKVTIRNVQNIKEWLQAELGPELEKSGSIAVSNASGAIENAKYARDIMQYTVEMLSDNYIELGKSSEKRTGFVHETNEAIRARVELAKHMNKMLEAEERYANSRKSKPLGKFIESGGFKAVVGSAAVAGAFYSPLTAITGIAVYGLMFRPKTRVLMAKYLRELQKSGMEIPRNIPLVTQGVVKFNRKGIIVPGDGVSDSSKEEQENLLMRIMLDIDTTKGRIDEHLQYGKDMFKFTRDRMRSAEESISSPMSSGRYGEATRGH